MKYNASCHLTMKYRLDRTYQILLLIITILIAYYPSLSDGLCSLDDKKMVESMSGLTSWSFSSTFLPQGQEGAYYRPLLFMSFLVDKYAWHLNPTFMHLANLVVHVMNAVLVYWLAYQLHDAGRHGGSLVPLASALFFGLHPITAESVNWISGRTDLLAGFFVLLSANFLLQYKRFHFRSHVMLSVLFLVCGFLSKEVALAFVPGALFLMSATFPDDRQAVHRPTEPVATGISNLSVPAVLILGALALFVLLRYSAFLTNDFRFAMTMQIMLSDLVHTTFIGLGMFGFYLKKLFFPFPLNFAIMDIDPFYELLAVPLLLMCIFIASKKNIIGAVFMTGLFLILPAFPFAFGQIAWTPYAERYLYVASAFVMVAAVRLTTDQIMRFPKHSSKAVVVIVIILMFMAGATFHRSIVWTNNEALFQDTVQKSPQFHLARSEYAYALASKGDIENARTQFIRAKGFVEQEKLSLAAKIASRPQIGYWPDADIGLAYLLEKEGKYTDAAEAYVAVYQRSGERMVGAMNRAVQMYGAMLLTADTAFKRKKIRNELSRHAHTVYSKKGDPHVLYETGKIELALGERRNAMKHFKGAYELLDSNDPYKQFAWAMMNRLENK